MAQADMALHLRKRRRRRRDDKPAISAHLMLDEHLKGDVGILSEDLFADLFPTSKSSPKAVNGTNHDLPSPEIQHVAISPWTPLSSTWAEDLSWTIIPIQRQQTENVQSKHLAQSTVVFPANSLALQTFAQSLRALGPTKLPTRGRPSIEIRVVDVVPLALDTVFVTVDGESLKNLEDAHSKIGGGFGGQVNGYKLKGRIPSNPAKSSYEDRLKEGVRKALVAPKVVHSGDLLPLPLPAHPITHAPPPPAKVSLCEPVSQGFLTPNTKIIVTQTRHRPRNSQQLPVQRLIKGVPEEDAEDTSNEQFYSAVEDGVPGTNSSPPGEEEELNMSTTDASDAELSQDESGGLSDDSMDDMISLNAPMLPPISSGIGSNFTAATPRPGGRATNGIGTPGSVFSSYTVTTNRGSTAKQGKIFKTQGLLQKIPDELLHPKPSSDDDEEVRIFVEISTLARIGCFSGDWVKVECHEPSITDLDHFGRAFEASEEASDWRVVRLFSLPEQYLPKHRYPVNKTAERRYSFPGLQPSSPHSKAYVSPILLSNMGDPSYIRISRLLSIHQDNRLGTASLPKSKISAASLPPFAKEVTLLKISTPLSTDRTLQLALLAGLKRYFEKKRRVVKSGDLVSITIDESLAKTIYQGSSGEDETGTDNMLSAPTLGSEGVPLQAKSFQTGVAWFKVGNVISSQESTEGRSWGGVAVVDAANTRMVQAGSEQSKLPKSTENAWQYYLGIKQPPRPGVGSNSITSAVADLPKPHIPPLRRRLRELIAASTSPRALHLGLPPVAILLVSTQRHIGKASLATGACSDLGIHVFTIDAWDILTDGGAGGGDVKTEAFFKARSERALSCGPGSTALLLRHVEALTAERMIPALKEVLAESRILVATTTEIDKVPDGLRALFTHELEMSAPDEGEREGILKDIIEEKAIRLASDVDLSGVAIKTAALVAGDLVDVVDRAVAARNERLENLSSKAVSSLGSVPILLRDLVVSGGEWARCVTKSDFDLAVDAARKNFADAIGAPKIPNVTWDDVGGLSNVKDAVMETIQLPLERPELFAKGMKKRSGILFYGPPGTGKTLLAKAIATEFSLNFFSVKGPELLNMYIGESEANVRRVFQRARDARPCVVFFDELDSVAPKRGNQGDSGGVMDRIVSQLLAELDGMSEVEGGGGGVFVIGATNRPDLLDQALLRPGRFDKMLYLGVSDTHDKQLTILEALTRKFSLHPTLSLRHVAEQLPFTYTGADLYALCSDAMLKAITRQADAVDEEIKKLPTGPVSPAYFFDHLASKEDIAVIVTEEDFLAAKRELVGSVSAKELEHYDRVRRTFEGSPSSVDAPISDRQHSGQSAGLPGRPRRFGSGRKGKGKQRVWTEDNSEGDNENSFEEDGHVKTRYNDSEEDTEDLSFQTAADLAGLANGKGKGKAKADDANDFGFGDAAKNDEEDLYSP